MRQVPAGWKIDEPVPTSLFDLCRAFEAVKSDDSVPVVVFDPKDADIGTFVTKQVQTRPHIRDTFTVITFSPFLPSKK